MERARERRPPEGDERLSGSNETDPQSGADPQIRRAGDGGAGEDKSQGGEKGTKVAPNKKPPRRSTDVGRALRSVYDDTLREDIPADLKDLLGRLG
ncbi:NepR family anti-sigma factor [Sphingomonas sp.]|uniref:NepR family anti-sigma factor n=1 Tax=Sphingomonas sp. TaxID=28214 RepID=UPI0037506CE6